MKERRGNELQVDDRSSNNSKKEEQGPERIRGDPKTGWIVWKQREKNKDDDDKNKKNTGGGRERNDAKISYMSNTNGKGKKKENEKEGMRRITHTFEQRRRGRTQETK